MHRYVVRLCTPADLQILFVSPLEDFDFVIHLDVVTLRALTASDKLNSQYRNVQAQSQQDMAIFGFDAVAIFVSELSVSIVAHTKFILRIQVLYGQNIVFFHGRRSPAVIAGLWSPVTANRPWKINLDYSTMPAADTEEDESQVAINKVGMLNEIAHLGGEMITKIDVNR